MLSLILTDPVVGMSTLEIGVTILTVVVIPWLVFVTKAIMKVSEGLDKVNHNVKWLRSEHEPTDDGVQHWKNPGLTEAFNKLSDILVEMRDILLRQHRDK